jgi:hypothetical protein
MMLMADRELLRIDMLLHTSERGARATGWTEQATPSTATRAGHAPNG